MGLRKLFSSSSSSSSRLCPASHAPVNKAEGKILCFAGCFGGGFDAEAAHQTASTENKSKKNKPFATIRRFLRRKAKSSSVNALLADEDTNADEARVPASSSQNFDALIDSVDTRIDGVEIVAVTETLDRETEKNSLPSFSSTESCDDKEGNREWLFSPILQSFRFDCSGVDGAATPEILLVDDKLASISSADTSGMVTCNDREGSQEPMVSPILKSVRLTSDSDDDAGTPEILSGIGTLERAKEEKMEYSLGSVSSLETGSTVTSADEDLNRETRVTLEMLMAMEDLLPEERNDRGEERGFELRDCVSGSVGRSPFVCWADRQSTMSVEPTSGSTIFAHPDALFPPSPRPLSSPSCSSVTNTGEARDQETKVDDKLACISLADTCNDREGSQEPTASPILSSVRVTSDSDDDSGTPEILSGIGTLERAKEEKMEYSLGSDSVSSLETGSTVTSADEDLNRETRVTLEMLMEMENLLPEERNDRGEERGFELRDCVSGSVGRSPFVCWADRQSTMSIEPSSGSTIFAHPETLFPPSPRHLSSPSCSTVTSTGEALDHETKAVLERLMAMENLLSWGRNDGEVEEFGVGDRVSGSVSRSPFVCWSNRQGRRTVEPSSGSPFFARPDTLFPLSPRPRSSSCPHSPSSVSTGRSRSKDGGRVSVSRSLDTGRGEKMSNSPPRSPSPPRSHWTVAGTSESQEWESRVTVEMLMMLENLLSEEEIGREVDMKFGVSSSPLVCWSH